MANEASCRHCNGNGWFACSYCGGIGAGGGQAGGFQLSPKGDRPVDVPGLTNAGSGAPHRSGTRNPEVVGGVSPGSNMTFISFADLDTGKAVGALLLKGRIHVQTDPVSGDDETIETGRYYTAEEMKSDGYEKIKVQVDDD